MIRRPLSRILSSLSGTPAEAGVRAASRVEEAASGWSQWNPCRSRGARSECGTWVYYKLPCLSGTPAEAGVRAWSHVISVGSFLVSVEPLPKQGCERAGLARPQRGSGLSGTPAEAGVRGSNRMETIMEWYESQWNPCRSRGTSLIGGLVGAIIATSQWNPCRSRGASLIGGLVGAIIATSQWNPCRSRGARKNVPQFQTRLE